MRKSLLDGYTFECPTTKRLENLTVYEIKNEMSMAFEKRYAKKDSSGWSQRRANAKNVISAGAAELKKRGRGYDDHINYFGDDDAHPCDPQALPEWIEVSQEKANEILKQEHANKDAYVISRLETESRGDKSLIFYYSSKQDSASGNGKHWHYSYIAKRETKTVGREPTLFGTERIEEIKYYVERDYIR